MHPSHNEKEREYQTRVILANSVQLSGDVIRRIVGNEIADSVEGEPLSNQELFTTLAAKTNSYLLNPVKE